MSAGKLRTGFSTGAAAAAAAKAATWALTTGQVLRSVDLNLPLGDTLRVPVNGVEFLSSGAVRATVIKDAGDDPDVTHRAAISSTVRALAGGALGQSVRIEGGPGVGRVTLPGLALEVGEAAINPVPRSMITEAVLEAWRKARPAGEGVLVIVEVSVKEGESLALRTLNPRLGIKGGISILGTTGLVRPFSHEAYTATISSACDVARAEGLEEVVLTTGGKSEKLAMALRPDLPEQAFVQIADFYAYALRKASQAGFRWVGLVSFFGKAVKQAQGLEYTHAHRAPMDLSWLSERMRQSGAGRRLCQEVAEANTARHALQILRQQGRMDLVGLVGEGGLASAGAFSGPGPDLWLKIVDFDGAVLFSGSRPGGGIHP